MMLVVVILSAFVVMLYRPTDIKARYQGERLMSDLRHMQMLALTRGAPLRFCGSANSYFVATVPGAVTACGALAPMTDPVTSGGFSVTLETGIQLFPAPVTFDVDALGRPANCPTATTCVVLAADTAIQVRVSGVTIYTVTVRQLTGFALIA